MLDNDTHTFSLDLYHIAFPSNPHDCKLVVYGIFFLEIGQITLGTWSLFQDMVYNFMDPLSIN